MSATVLTLPPPAELREIHDYTRAEAVRHELARVLECKPAVVDRIARSVQEGRLRRAIASIQAKAEVE